MQETGENDASLYESLKKKEEADACFYRGGFFNWFEGGPTSSFLDRYRLIFGLRFKLRLRLRLMLCRDSPGYRPEDGTSCIAAGKYCASGAELDYWFPCNTKMVRSSFLSQMPALCLFLMSCRGNVDPSESCPELLLTLCERPSLLCRPAAAAMRPADDCGSGDGVSGSAAPARTRCSRAATSGAAPSRSPTTTTMGSSR